MELTRRGFLGSQGALPARAETPLCADRSQRRGRDPHGALARDLRDAGAEGSAAMAMPAISTDSAMESKKMIARFLNELSTVVISSHRPLISASYKCCVFISL